jgi:hypothetical protein
VEKVVIARLGVEGGGVTIFGHLDRDRWVYWQRGSSFALDANKDAEALAAEHGAELLEGIGSLHNKLVEEATVPSGGHITRRLHSVAPEAWRDHPRGHGMPPRADRPSRHQHHLSEERP